MSEMMRVQTDCLSIMMIVILLTSPGSFDFKKKMIEKKLVSLLKNSFLINLSAFCLSIFSVILMIQISAFLKALLSDFLKSLSLISASSDLSDAVLAGLLISLVSQNMCLCCSK